MGAYTYPPEWFNNDDNFSQVLNETLYLQRILVSEIRRLESALDKPELNLRGWKARGPARVVLLAGFMLARTNTSDVFIDLREAELTPSDGAQVSYIPTATYLHTY